MVIEIEVTAEDGVTTKTYTITVSRAAAPIEPTWTKISSADAQIIATGIGLLAASFDGTGLYNNGNWNLLTTYTTQALATDGTILVASFKDLGV